MPRPLTKWLMSPLPLKPFYFVVGTEPFLISEIKRVFIKHVHQGKGLGDFNHDELSAGELSAGDILALLETLPFMAEKRLVFCGQAEKLSDRDWEELKPALPSARSIFVCFFEKKDGRKRAFKFLSEKAEELSAAPPRPWEMGPWLDFLFKKEKLRLAPPAKALFSQLTEGRLSAAHLELKKLKIFAGGRKEISEEDILACVSRQKLDSVFDLAHWIGQKDMIQALKALAELLGQNQNEIGAMALVARHIRILSKLKEGKRQNLSSSRLAQKAGVPPYFLKSYLAQSALWPERQIHQALSALFETDKALKSSPLSAHIWLENFILKVCS